MALFTNPTPPAPPPPRKASQLEREWYVYHQNNPRVYQLICTYADIAIKSGYTDHYAIATIWERIRWEIMVVTKDENFKMPNNHRAYYARLWNKDHPQYPDYFRTAELRSQRQVHVDRFGRPT